MAGNFVSPLASVGGFQNQQLQRFTAPSVAPTMPSRQPTMVNDETSMPSMQGFENISDRASRQHNMFLSALKAQQARRQPQMPTGTSGGSRGPSGPMGGRYNLVAGADQALQAMNAAFRQRFGYDVKINSGGRTYAEQAAAYARYKAGKGNLAAAPGHSVHESGRAIDLGGAFQNAGSAEHRWLQANAYRWGFKWTGKNFKQFEPWHWEWQG